MSCYFEHSDSNPFAPEGHAHLVPIFVAVALGFAAGFAVAFFVL